MDEKNMAVLYLRLSKEDKDKLVKGDDSASIRNQRLLLADYALQHDFRIVDVYSDDDESGLFDTRPEFDRMLTDAKLGKFQVVIAKSQSRFSRNMEHVEKYLHHDFQNLGIRFIGVVDGADTANMGNKKSRQINGLVNEWYCEDLSANIRSAFKAKMRDGQYLGSSCPYGYMKDPKNHNHLVIDEYAAGIVKRIFYLYLKGKGKAKIGRILTEEGVLIPTLYKREILGIPYHNARELKTTRSWSYQTIHSILNNEVYIGNMVQNKYNNLSYKDKKHVRQPKDQWICVAGTHEAIIDLDTFRKVQERQKIRTKSVSPAGKDSVFSGIIFCADCKHAMVRTYERRGSHRFVGYCCKTYKTQGKKICTSHTIRYEQLKTAVLRSIQKEAKKILTPSKIGYLKQVEAVSSLVENYQSQIQYLEKEIERRESYKKKTYQNYMDDLISREEYISYVRQFESENAHLREKAENMKVQSEGQKRLDYEYSEWIERFINYIDVKEMTWEMALEFIERIEVNEDGSINIYYKFRNQNVM
ncbi:recombinase family protein [Sporofaciens musculi]|uniref:recombinase family protein n=1 Tax=Sporofaciens musculi TaxID=2681861 RepID=UPI00258CAFF0|nr:recombinase family protein [Sporofaciens musculi]